MAALLRRIVIRGAIVFAIVFGLVVVLRQLLIQLLSSGPVELKTDGNLWGPTGYGLFAVGVLALLEWLTYARGRLRGSKAAGDRPGAPPSSPAGGPSP